MTNPTDQETVRRQTSEPAIILDVTEIEPEPAYFLIAIGLAGLIWLAIGCAAWELS